MPATPSAEYFASLVPDELRRQSGEVFYSGRAAFSKPSPVYLLGINPGSAPDHEPDPTIAGNIRRTLTEHPAEWSSYESGQWKSDQHAMQSHIVALLKHIGREPRFTPASNLIFPRSRSVAEMSRQEASHLTKLCWPFHEAVIKHLNVRAVICLGSDAGKAVARILNANTANPLDTFIENNNRKWPSYAYRANNGMIVFSLTHPSRVNWSNPAADPSPMVKSVLDAHN